MTVQQIQHLLGYLGYRIGIADGINGPLTETAVREFQEDNSLIPVDGIPGEMTQKALRDAVTHNRFRPIASSPEEPETGTFWDEIEYFNREEFRCQCGGKYCNGFPAEPQEAMVRLAEAARRHFGRPATVASGLRCPIHNANVGGVADSQHMYGEACDIYISGISGDAALAWFLTQPGVRYAYQIQGTNNIHFDIPKGQR